MVATDRFSTYTFSEVRTGGGQFVEFTCTPDDVEQVKEFLGRSVRTIDIPVTGRVNVGHGGYGRYTRYDIEQHDYAGGGGPGCGGYIEVLEIKDAPDGRCGIVIHEDNTRDGSVFTEWETLENARAAFKKHWGTRDSAEGFPKLPGFKRRVSCGALIPWFYAIGDQQLIGDYAFPERLQDDPVYLLGRKFMVFDDEGFPMLKTCMGTRFIERKRDYPPYDTYYFRIVYWDDGSLWDENCTTGIRGKPPCPVAEGDLWITEAIQQFHEMLAGKRRDFTIDFTDGNKFVGKVVRPNNRTRCAEGDYSLVVHLEGKAEPIKGWVNDFKPTPEDPDIIRYVTKRYEQQGKTVERIEVTDSKTQRGGKKWAGAFFHLSPEGE